MAAWNCSNVQRQYLYTGSNIYFKGWSSYCDNSLLIWTIAWYYGFLTGIILYRITVSKTEKTHVFIKDDWWKENVWVCCSCHLLAKPVLVNNYPSGHFTQGTECSSFLIKFCIWWIWDVSHRVGQKFVIVSEEATASLLLNVCKFLPTKWHHSPEDSILHSYYHETLKSHFMCIYCTTLSTKRIFMGNHGTYSYQYLMYEWICVRLLLSFIHVGDISWEK